MSKSNRLLWMDMEMTGLDPKRERVIEIATLVTDAELNIIAEGPEFVIHQPDEVLDAMDAWNKSHHGESGLIEQVKNSTISESEAENRTLDFIKEHCPAKKIPLAGNSVHQDRLFVQAYMPKIDDYLHYRNVDVSTIKELTRRWFPTISAQTPEKQNTHRALDDIRESIAELRYYREHVFVKLHK